MQKKTEPKAQNPTGKASQISSNRKPDSSRAKGNNSRAGSENRGVNKKPPKPQQRELSHDARSVGGNS